MELFSNKCFWLDSRLMSYKIKVVVFVAAYIWNALANASAFSLLDSRVMSSTSIFLNSLSHCTPDQSVDFCSWTSAQLLHGCSAADVSFACAGVAPPTHRRPPPSSIRIVLLDIKGGIRIVRQSHGAPVRRGTWHEIDVESHKSVNVAEYIVCSFMHKTRHILSIKAQSWITIGIYYVLTDS